MTPDQIKFLDSISKLHSILTDIQCQIILNQYNSAVFDSNILSHAALDLSNSIFMYAINKTVCVLNQ
jgi:hypothetical protein